MAITAKEIAEIVGVSRGTVDRALHNRGRVSPQMKQRIEEVAKEHGFEPSHMGRALARARNPVKIGVVIHLAQLPFFEQVMKGIKAATAQLANLGGTVLVEKIDTLDPLDHLAAVERLVAQGVKGIAIAPVDDTQLISRLNTLHREKGIEIVTLNTDIAGIERRCFVGLDNVRSGRTAAGLMHQMLGKQGGSVLIISGFLTNHTNSDRVDGFGEVIQKYHPEIIIPGIQFNRDDKQSAFEIVTKALHTTPNLAGIYMVSAGQAGACRALQQAGRQQDVRLIVFDMLPDTLRYMQNGTINFIIDQNAFEQGSLPPRILFDYLFDGKAEYPENHYIDITIKTMYN